MTRNGFSGRILRASLAGAMLFAGSQSTFAGDIEIDPASAPAVSYHAEQLPTFDGFPYPRTADIDDDGDVVGTCWACPFILSCLSQTFLYTHGDLVHTSEEMINAVPEPHVGAPVSLDMSNTNKIVIRMAVPDVGVYHYLWDNGETILISGDPDDNPNQGPLVPIPPPLGTAWAVNDDGTVVGNVFLDGVSNVFLWDRNNGVTELMPVPKGFDGISGRDINNHGHVVGATGTADASFIRGYVWADGRLTILEPLPGHIESQALLINDDGIVAGISREPTAGNHVRHLVKWQNGRIIDSVILDHPGGLIQSPNGISASGDVVGWYWPTGEAAQHFGYIWTPEHGFVDLNGTVENIPELNIWSAEGINESGQIAVWAEFPDFTGGAFLLTPNFDAPGDLNGDDVVDEQDRALFCAAIGSSSVDPGFIDAADLNDDSVIDHLDLALFNDILPPCAGDVVTSDTFAPPPDGVTDGADLAFLLGAWSGGASCADMVTSKTFAPPPDGNVDGADLAFLLGSWGRCD